MSQPPEKKEKCPFVYERAKKMERERGIEPPWPAWKAGVLPLNYTRSEGDIIYRKVLSTISNIGIGVKRKERWKMNVRYNSNKKKTCENHGKLKRVIPFLKRDISN